MQSLIILHTNDIHGRVEGLARIATLVAQIKDENPETPVLYFDIGDVEEPARRLSNVTKGAGMHRLLNLAGCDAAVTGNGAWLRYGPQILAKHTAVARYPILGANLRQGNGDPMDGVQPSVLPEVEGLRLGLVGLTASFPGHAASFNLHELPPAPFVRERAAQLNADGADAIIVLSHMGLPTDRELAQQLSGEVLLILGAHTHDLLPEGEQVEGVWVAQAGEYAQHLGRIDLTCDGELAVSRVSVIPITDNIAPSPAVLAEAERIEAEGQAYLDEIIGELIEPLDFAADQECGAANLMADVMCQRMKADFAVAAAGEAFEGPLPAGPLRRGALWDVCSSTANPAAVELTGEQLTQLLTKGLDLVFAGERIRSLRGRPRGLFHISGGTIKDGVVYIGDAPLDPERTYRVAGSDWEFEPYGGYVPKEWGLQPEYDMPTILREAVEDYLRDRGPIHVTGGRLGGIGERNAANLEKSPLD